MMKKYNIQALAICLILLTILFAPNISLADDENETENNIEDVIKELQTESLQTSTNIEKLQLNSRRYVVYDRNTRIKYIWKR